MSKDDNPKSEKIENNSKYSLKIEMLEKTSTLVAAAFAFVAAFAWNESFKLLFDRIFSDDVEIFVYFIYSVVVTVIAVLIIILIARATGKAKARIQ